MPTYTVHEPLPRKSESVTAPEHFVFVRDGFHFWAFVLAPLWLLVNRLWLAFFIYVIANVIIAVALTFADAPPFVQTAVAIVIALLVGLEASSIQRWTFARRGWKNLGFVIGEVAEMAEQRFYAAFADRAPRLADKPPAEPVYATPVRRGPPSSSDVIGLFPEPGTPPGLVR